MHTSLFGPMFRLRRRITCSHCGLATDVIAHRYAGCANRVWVCEACGKQVAHSAVAGSGGHWIPKAFHESLLNDENLPVFHPEWYTERPCARCGATDMVELHHFAPRALFGADCDQWPKAYLCRSCHERWHTIVTPSLVRVHHDATIPDFL